jgi:hypothetical protein
LEDSEARQGGGQVVDHEFIGVPFKTGHVSELEPRPAGGLQTTEAGLDGEPVFRTHCRGVVGRVFFVGLGQGH